MSEGEVSLINDYRAQLAVHRNLVGCGESLLRRFNIQNSNDAGPAYEAFKSNLETSFNNDLAEFEKKLWGIASWPTSDFAFLFDNVGVGYIEDQLNVFANFFSPRKRKSDSDIKEKKAATTKLINENLLKPIQVKFKDVLNVDIFTELLTKLDGAFMLLQFNADFARETVRMNNIDKIFMIRFLQYMLKKVNIGISYDTISNLNKNLSWLKFYTVLLALEKKVYEIAGAENIFGKSKDLKWKQKEIRDLLSENMLSLKYFENDVNELLNNVSSLVDAKKYFETIRKSFNEKRMVIGNDMKNKIFEQLIAAKVFENNSLTLSQILKELFGRSNNNVEEILRFLDELSLSEFKMLYGVNTETEIKFDKWADCFPYIPVELAKTFYNSKLSNSRMKLNDTYCLRLWNNYIQTVISQKSSADNRKSIENYLRTKLGVIDENLTQANKDIVTLSLWNDINVFIDSEGKLVAHSIGDLLKANLFFNADGTKFDIKAVLDKYAIVQLDSFFNDLQTLADLNLTLENSEVKNRLASTYKFNWDDKTLWDNGEPNKNKIAKRMFINEIGKHIIGDEFKEEDIWFKKYADSKTDNKESAGKVLNQLIDKTIKAINPENPNFKNDGNEKSDSSSESAITQQDEQQDEQQVLLRNAIIEEISRLGRFSKKRFMSRETFNEELQILNKLCDSADQFIVPLNNSNGQEYNEFFYLYVWIFAVLVYENLRPSRKEQFIDVYKSMFNILKDERQTNANVKKYIYHSDFYKNLKQQLPVNLDNFVDNDNKKLTEAKKQLAKWCYDSRDNKRTLEAYRYALINTYNLSKELVLKLSDKAVEELHDSFSKKTYGSFDNSCVSAEEIIKIKYAMLDNLLENTSLNVSDLLQGDCYLTILKLANDNDAEKNDFKSRVKAKLGLSNFTVQDISKKKYNSLESKYGDSFEFFADDKIGSVERLCANKKVQEVFDILRDLTLFSYGRKDQYANKIDAIKKEAIKIFLNSLSDEVKNNLLSPTQENEFNDFVTKMCSYITVEQVNNEYKIVFKSEYPNFEDNKFVVAYAKLRFWLQLDDTDKTIKDQVKVKKVSREEEREGNLERFFLDATMNKKTLNEDKSKNKCDIRNVAVENKFCSLSANDKNKIANEIFGKGINGPIICFINQNSNNTVIQLDGNEFKIANKKIDERVVKLLFLYKVAEAEDNKTNVVMSNLYTDDDFSNYVKLYEIIYARLSDDKLKEQARGHLNLPLGYDADDLSRNDYNKIMAEMYSFELLRRALYADTDLEEEVKNDLRYKIEQGIIAEIKSSTTKERPVKKNDCKDDDFCFRAGILLPNLLKQMTSDKDKIYLFETMSKAHFMLNKPEGNNAFADVLQELNSYFAVAKVWGTNLNDEMKLILVKKVCNLYDKLGFNIDVKEELMIQKLVECILNGNLNCFAENMDIKASGLFEFFKDVKYPANKGNNLEDRLKFLCHYAKRYVYSNLHNKRNDIFDSVRGLFIYNLLSTVLSLADKDGLKFYLVPSYVAVTDFPNNILESEYTVSKIKEDNSEIINSGSKEIEAMLADNLHSKGFLNASKTEYEVNKIILQSNELNFGKYFIDYEKQQKVEGQLSRISNYFKREESNNNIDVKVKFYLPNANDYVVDYLKANDDNNEMLINWIVKEAQSQNNEGMDSIKKTLKKGEFIFNKFDANEKMISIIKKADAGDIKTENNGKKEIVDATNLKLWNYKDLLWLKQDRADNNCNKLDFFDEDISQIDNINSVEGIDQSILTAFKENVKQMYVELFYRALSYDKKNKYSCADKLADLLNQMLYEELCRIYVNKDGKVETCKKEYKKLKLELEQVISIAKARLKSYFSQSGSDDFYEKYLSQKLKIDTANIETKDESKKDFFDVLEANYAAISFDLSNSAVKNGDYANARKDAYLIKSFADTLKQKHMKCYDSINAYERVLQHSMAAQLDSVLEKQSNNYTNDIQRNFNVSFYAFQSPYEDNEFYLNHLRKNSQHLDEAIKKDVKESEDVKNFEHTLVYMGDSVIPNMLYKSIDMELVKGKSSEKTNEFQKNVSDKLASLLADKEVAQPTKDVLKRIKDLCNCNIELFKLKAGRIGSDLGQKLDQLNNLGLDEKEKEYLKALLPPEDAYGDVSLTYVTEHKIDSGFKVRIYNLLKNYLFEKIAKSDLPDENIEISNPTDKNKNKKDYFIAVQARLSKLIFNINYQAQANNNNNGLINLIGQFGNDIGDNDTELLKSIKAAVSICKKLFENNKTNLDELNLALDGEKSKVMLNAIKQAVRENEMLSVDEYDYLLHKFNIKNFETNPFIMLASATGIHGDDGDEIYYYRDLIKAKRKYFYRGIEDTTVAKVEDKIAEGQKYNMVTKLKENVNVIKPEADLKQEWIKYDNKVNLRWMFDGTKNTNIPDNGSEENNSDKSELVLREKYFNKIVDAIYYDYSDFVKNEIAFLFWQRFKYKRYDDFKDYLKKYFSVKFADQSADDLTKIYEGVNYLEECFDLKLPSNFMERMSLFVSKDDKDLIARELFNMLPLIVLERKWKEGKDWDVEFLMKAYKHLAIRFFPKLNFLWHIDPKKFKMLLEATRDNSIIDIDNKSYAIRKMDLLYAFFQVSDLSNKDYDAFKRLDSAKLNKLIDSRIEAEREIIKLQEIKLDGRKTDEVKSKIEFVLKSIFDMERLDDNALLREYVFNVLDKEFKIDDAIKNDNSLTDVFYDLLFKSKKVETRNVDEILFSIFSKYEINPDRKTEVTIYQALCLLKWFVCKLNDLIEDGKPHAITEIFSIDNTGIAKLTNQELVELYSDTERILNRFKKYGKLISEGKAIWNHELAIKLGSKVIDYSKNERENAVDFTNILEMEQAVKKLAQNCKVPYEFCVSKLPQGAIWMIYRILLQLHNENKDILNYELVTEQLRRCFMENTDKFCYNEHDLILVTSIVCQCLNVKLNKKPIPAPDKLSLDINNYFYSLEHENQKHENQKAENPEVNFEEKLQEFKQAVLDDFQNVDINSIPILKEYFHFILDNAFSFTYSKKFDLKSLLKHSLVLQKLIDELSVAQEKNGQLKEEDLNEEQKANLQVAMKFEMRILYLLKCKTENKEISDKDYISFANLYNDEVKAVIKDEFCYQVCKSEKINATKTECDKSFRYEFYKVKDKNSSNTKLKDIIADSKWFKQYVFVDACENELNEDTPLASIVWEKPNKEDAANIQSNEESNQEENTEYLDSRRDKIFQGVNAIKVNPNNDSRDRVDITKYKSFIKFDCLEFDDASFNGPDKDHKSKFYKDPYCTDLMITEEQNRLKQRIEAVNKGEVEAVIEKVLYKPENAKIDFEVASEALNGTFDNVNKRIQSGKLYISDEQIRNYITNEMSVIVYNMLLEMGLTCMLADNVNKILTTAIATYFSTMLVIQTSWYYAVFASFRIKAMNEAYELLNNALTENLKGIYLESRIHRPRGSSQIRPASY